MSDDRGAPDFSWTDRAVREALGLRTENAVDELEYTGVTTDSRTAVPGDLYVALRGERFDGHDFVADALAGGARGAVVSRPVAGADTAVLYPVDDTLVALGRLARHRRERLPARVVGITGSSGKTTTKEMVAAALGESKRVHATPGNLNNRIGLPRTLLAAPADAEVVVVEMGTNEPGEIGILTDIARPEVGVVTTVGASHLEKLGSVEGVLDEKLDLLRHMPAGGRAVVGDEPPELPEAAREIDPDVRVVGWSDRADPDLRPGDVEVDHWGYHRFQWKGRSLLLGLAGRHAVVDALLALAVAEIMGVGPAAAARGVASVRPGEMRGEIRKTGDLTLLLDCYNANPQSVVAALDLLGSHGQEVRRVAVLGTMLELGARSDELHEAVLDEVLDRDLELVAATGCFARPARVREAEDRRLVVAEEPRVAYTRLRERLRGDEVVLLKASRGVALEKLVPLFEEDFGAAPPDGVGEGEA